MLRFLTVALTLMISGAAFAQTGAQPSAEKAPAIRFETQIVKGKRHEPQAFYVLPRSRVKADEVALKRSFLPKIVKSAEAL